MYQTTVLYGSAPITNSHVTLARNQIRDTRSGPTATLSKCTYIGESARVVEYPILAYITSKPVKCYLCALTSMSIATQKETKQ